MTKFKPGDYVVWKWATGHGHGTVVSVDTERTEIDSRGKRIVRNGTVSNPAVTIHDHNNTPVIKLASELQKADET
jgi:hypothetical protein